MKSILGCTRLNYYPRREALHKRQSLVILVTRDQ